MSTSFECLKRLSKVAITFGVCSTLLIGCGGGDSDSSESTSNSSSETLIAQDTRLINDTEDSLRALTENNDDHLSSDHEAEMIEETVVPIVPDIDYKSFRLSEHAPPVNAEFTHFKKYTLTIKNPLSEIIGQQPIYLKVMDDQGNNYYLDRLESQSFSLQLDLEMGVKTLYIQIFSKNVETILGVIAV